VRGGVKRIGRVEEEESAFVSMTDMTVSFLFIVMILLAFFASQLHSSDQVPRPEFDAVTRARDALREQLDSAAKEVAALRRKVDQLNSLLVERDARIEVLGTQNERLQSRIAELEGVSRERDALRAQLDSVANQVAALQRKVDQQNSLLAERDARIEDLTTQNAKLESRVAELEAELKRLKPDNPMETYLAKVAEQRKNILESLQARLKIDFPDLQVIVSAETDALRFKGDGLFKHGEFALLPTKKRIVETIASRLNEILPCYTIGRLSSWKTECNEVGAVIEAVQIEGHTDSTGDDAGNLTLSTNRANETFFAMTKREPNLTEHLNSRGQPVISVAGYGKMRPVADNTTLEGQATNRRIDLRLIMYTPRSVEDIDRIREDLRMGVPRG
jgi:outer membrane protein OmpA-like peptidoglycan-associated protein